MGAEAAKQASRASVPVIFDSDILIWVFRRDPLATALLLSQRERAASIVTLMELLAEATSKTELSTTRGFLVEFEIEVIPVTAPISYSAARLIEDHCLADGLDIPDALIAATARERGETLATANYRHFHKVPNLSLHRFRPARRS